MNNSINQLKKSIRDVPDFPKKGIIFKDITTLLKENDNLKLAADILTEMYSNKGITKVVGIESRGFILGSIIAYNLNAGFVLLRKPGKLPADCYSVSYDLEYGSDTLEIHKDAIKSEDIILLHDDLLATGGSAMAALKLIENFKPEKIFINFLIELKFLSGREKLNGADIYSLIKY